MNIKPILSMSVIEKYMDNIDEIKLSSNIAKYSKEKMTTEELRLYNKNYEMIIKEFGDLKESSGGARWIS